MPLNLGLGLHLGSGGGVGSPYSAEAQAYFAAMPNNTFSADEKLAIDIFISGLIADGIWAKIDQLYLLCGKTTVKAETLRNMKYPTYAASASASTDPKSAMKIIVGGSPDALTFTSGVGWATTSTTEKLCGMYTPNGNSNFKLSDSHVMLFLQNEVAGKNAGFAYGSKYSGLYSYIPKSAAGYKNTYFGSSTLVQSGSGQTVKGIHIISYAESSKYRVYQNNVAKISVDTVAQDYYPETDYPITLLSHYNNSDHFTGVVGMYSIGGGLTFNAQNNGTGNLYNTRLATLLGALGLTVEG